MWVFLAILAVPLIEIGLFVQLGGAIGLWPTLAWVLVSAGFGIVVLKGVAMYGPITLSPNMREMSDPLSPLANRVMVVMAGGLLILPGFFTDVFGLLLLIPPFRLVVIKLVGRKLGLSRMATSQTTIIEGEWKEASPASAPAAPTQEPPPGVTRH